MAGTGAVYYWDDKDLQKLVVKGIGRIEDMTPVMKPFSEYMVARTDERFVDEESPSGAAWTPLKTATVAEKRRNGKIDKILQRDGFLRLVHPDADHDSAGVFSDRVYANIHNAGGMAGPNLSVEIPQRKFLGFNDEDIGRFQDTVADYVVFGRAA